MYFNYMFLNIYLEILKTFLEHSVASGFLELFLNLFVNILRTFLEHGVSFKHN